jgi:micrococcal nuclease
VTGRIAVRRLIVGVISIGLTVAATAEARRARAAEPGGPSPSCVVWKVADGDTFSCTDRTRVRLLLIDTPERSQKPFGQSARQQLQKLLRAGDTVRLELDVQPRDRYDRVLAYVYLRDGRMVNEEMARAGYAVVLSYPPNVRHLERVRGAVRCAQAAKRGLWGTSAFECSPRDHRRKRC